MGGEIASQESSTNHDIKPVRHLFVYLHSRNGACGLFGPSGNRRGRYGNEDPSRTSDGDRRDRFPAGYYGQSDIAATVAMLSMLSGYHISLMDILMISVPCTLLGVLAGAIYSLRVGKELDQDPEYLKRVANHEFSTKHYETKGVENQKKAALSVAIFVLATIAIVIFGSMESLRPVFTVGTEKVSMQMSHIIEVLMLTASAFILLFTKTDGIKAAQGSVFSAGMQAVVAIFGIAWMGDTFIAGNMTELKGSIEHIGYTDALVIRIGPFRNVHFII